MNPPEEVVRRLRERDLIRATLKSVILDDLKDANDNTIVKTARYASPSHPDHIMMGFKLNGVEHTIAISDHVQDVSAVREEVIKQLTEHVASYLL